MKTSAGTNRDLCKNTANLTPHDLVLVGAFNFTHATRFNPLPVANKIFITHEPAQRRICAGPT